jgi:hypothetical protein
MAEIESHAHTSFDGYRQCVSERMEAGLAAGMFNPNTPEYLKAGFKIMIQGWGEVPEMGYVFLHQHLDLMFIVDSLLVGDLDEASNVVAEVALNMVYEPMSKLAFVYWQTLEEVVGNRSEPKHGRFM